MLPANEGRSRVDVPERLPALAGEAGAWTVVPPTSADVNNLATALGVGGRVAESPGGFTVEGGAAPLIARYETPIFDWRFELGPCDPGVCVVPPGPEAGPEPVVTARPPGLVAPDDPPAEWTAVAVAMAVARRLAARLDAEAVAVDLGLGEWRARLGWRVGDVVTSGFTVHVRPDGSVRFAHGMLTRPGEEAGRHELVGVRVGLDRLAAAGHGAIRNFVGWGAHRDRTLIVTGVRLGHRLDGPRFMPVYEFEVTAEGSMPAGMPVPAT